MKKINDDVTSGGGAAPPTFDLVAAPNPFAGTGIVTTRVEAGCSLADMGAGEFVVAFVDGEQRDDLDYKPLPGQVVLLKSVPGSGNSGRMFAMIAVLVIASAASGGAAGVFGGTQAGWFAGLSLAGQLAVNALIPPPSPNLDTGSAFRPFNQIQRTNNRIDQFGAVAKLFGTHRIWPNYAAMPLPVSAGGQQDFLGLYCAGYRDQNIDVSTMKLGNTPLTDFEESQVRIWDYTKNEDIEEIYTIGATNDDDPGDLKEAGAEVLRTTPSNTRRIEIEVGGGPLGYAGEKNSKRIAVGVRIEYKETGDPDWIVAQPTYVAGDGGVDVDYPSQVDPGGLYEDYDYDPGSGPEYGPAGWISGNWNDRRNYTVTWAVDFPTAATYDIRLTRLEAVRPNIASAVDQEYQFDFYDDNDDKVYQEITLIRMRNVVVGAGSAPAALDPRFAYVALRLKASDQLNGAVDDFNFVSRAVVPVWNGTSYVMQESNNPAWAYRDVLVGSANSDPQDADLIDDEAIIEWAAACDAETPPREFNAVFDAPQTVRATLNSIARAGRASYAKRDNKYTIVRDIAGKTPVQIFTPRNSWDFSANKVFIKMPHAIKGKFINEETGWFEAERIVYNDGYSEDGADDTEVATKFESISYFGTTNKDVVFKDARYDLAVGKLRPETFTWKAAIEHLVCQRGDVVRLQHDAILVGLGAGRIKAIAGATITVDEQLLIEAMKSYGGIIRQEDGDEVVVAFSDAPGTYNTFTISGGVPAGTNVGDLISFGEVGKVAQEILITGITPFEQLNAEITGVPYSSPAVHEADQGEIPAYDPLITMPQTRPPAPRILNIDSSRALGITATNGAFTPRIFVAYAFPESDVLIPMIDAEYRPTDQVGWVGIGPLSNSGTVIFEVSTLSDRFDFRIRGRAPNGTPGPWTEVFDYLLETVSSNGDVVLSLVEQRNQPATPNKDLSTVVVTTSFLEGMELPSDPNYSHSFIDYRRPLDAEWIVVGPTDVNGQAFFIVNSDGATYQVRARAVSISGQTAEFGTIEEITISLQDGEVPVGDPDAALTPDASLNVANLRILGELPAVDEFVGRDAKLIWDEVSPGTGTLRDYRVRIIDPTSGDTMRITYIVGVYYKYSIEDNRDDAIRLGYDGPLRAFTVDVIARTREGSRSATIASKDISNPAPTLPLDFDFAADANRLVINFTRPDDGDYYKTQVHLSTAMGFTPSNLNEVYDGFETKPIIVPNLAYAEQYYFRVTLWDEFGPASPSIEYDFMTDDLPGTDTIPPTVPGVPSLSSAVESSALYATAHLEATWTASTDANPFFYEVEWWRSDQSANPSITRTPFNNITIRPVEVNKTYFMRVRAIDYSGNESAWSASASHLVAAETTPPANVTSPAASSILAGVLLEWVNPVDADFLSVQIYRGTAAGFTANSGSLIATAGYQSTSYIDQDAPAATDVYYKFTTTDVLGNMSTATSAVGPVQNGMIDAANVGSYIADAAIQAGQVGFQIGGANLVINSSFESDENNDNFPDAWPLGGTAVVSNTDGAFLQVGGPGVEHGTKALKFQIVTPHDSYVYQDVTLTAGTYAFSAYVTRTSVTPTTGKGSGINLDVTSGGGTVTVEAMSHTPVGGLANPYDLILTGTNARRREWMIISFTADAVVRIYLQQGYGGGLCTGTTIFDAIQVEHGDVLTAYAPRPYEINAGTITATQIADNAVTSPKIIAGAVIAGKIAADAVEAGNVAANAIRTRELIVGDFTNLVENYDFEFGPVGWDLSAGGVIVNDPANAYQGNWVLRDIYPAIHAVRNKFEARVQPGDQFYANARIKVSGGANAYVRLRGKDASGTEIWTSNGNVIVSATYQLSQVSAAVPASVVSVNVEVVAASAGTMYLDQVSMFRMAGSALIQDAAIINAKIANLAVDNAKISSLDAAKITTGFLDAARIQAGTITAVKLSVSQLSAISADMGTITAGTVTGAMLQTSASNPRVELSLGGIASFNAAGQITAYLGNNGNGFVGLNPGNVQWNTSGTTTIAGNLAMTGNIAMSLGSIYGGKTTYASSTAGYWMGFDSGAAKFHIGNSTDKLQWTGSALIANNIATAISGQRVVLTAGNETQFYDEFGTLASTIGIFTDGSDSIYVWGGIRSPSGAIAGNATQQARIGLHGYSGTSKGVRGVSRTGDGVEGFAWLGIGVRGRTAATTSYAGIAQAANLGNAGVIGDGFAGSVGGAFIGIYGLVAQQSSATAGASLTLSAGSSTTVAPTHSAQSGSMCMRFIGGVAKIYLQTAGGHLGSGTTWVLIGNAI